MPKGYKTSRVIVAEVKMTRTVQKGAVVIVEGPSDEKFWRPRCQGGCSIVDGEGKGKVVEAIELLDQQDAKGVLGIVDADYDRLEEEEPRSENLVMLDTHDLECLLCRSSALNMVLAEFAVPSKIENLEAEEGVDVRTALLSRTLVFGKLRWAIVRFGLTVGADPVRIHGFVHEDSWRVDSEGLYDEVARILGRYSASNLKDYVARLPDADPWETTRGHDMIGVLRIGLRQVLGEGRRNVSDEQITRVLRVSIPSTELAATAVCERIKNWEKKNPMYRVLSL